jgi:hypothetical protein
MQLSQIDFFSVYEEEQHVEVVAGAEEEFICGSKQGWPTKTDMKTNETEQKT